jgi:ATP-dependent Clp protease ATP-binding subunit ClpC
MELALEEGKLFHQGYIGTEHILGGLLRSHDPLVTSVLGSFDLKLDDVRTTLHTIIASGLMPAPPSREILTRRSRRVLDSARGEAGTDPVRPAHLLLALLQEGGGVAAQIMTALDIDVVDVRAKLLERLASPDQPGLP